MREADKERRRSGEEKTKREEVRDQHNEREREKIGEEVFRVLEKFPATHMR